MGATYDDLTTAAKVAVDQCLKVQPGEQVAIVFDEPCRSVAVALKEAALEAGAEVVLAEMTPRKQSSEEPPKPIAALMAASDVIFAPTSKSLSHTDARRQACEKGARVGTLPGITDDVFARTLIADYDRIAQRGNQLAEKVDGCTEVTITSPQGTDVTLSLKGRKVMADTGLVHESGGMSNLPAGEVFFAPVEGTANGRVVIDGSIGQSGILESPIVVEIVDGLVVSLSGDPYHWTLQNEMDAAGQEARNVAEVGIGTHDGAGLVGNVLEDEKILGTVHVAFGDNASMGGRVTAPFHQDGIILHPVLAVDGEVILKNGQFLINLP